MSSDGTGAVGKAATAAEDGDAGAVADPGSPRHLEADQAQLADPWFAPGLKDDPAADGGAFDEAVRDEAVRDEAVRDEAVRDEAVRDEAVRYEAVRYEARPDEAVRYEARPDEVGTAQQAEWFLRTGRAGLLPDSMTVAWDNDDAAAGPSAGHAVRVEAAGAPPWAAETTDALASAPPPWETGPWPGPGDLRLAGAGAADGDLEADALAGAANGRALNGASARNGVGPGAGAGGESLAGQDRWSPRTVLTAGLIPLIVPGLVLGIVSLRQSAGPAVRRASWLAIVASTTWAVIIILIVAGTSGGGASSCGSYPAAVHQAYEKALTDLTGHEPASVQAADLGTAASRANASAAAAGQIGIRTALFAMANDMAQARADVVAQRPVPAALLQHLVKDGAAPTGSCSA